MNQIPIWNGMKIVHLLSKLSAFGDRVAELSSLSSSSSSTSSSVFWLQLGVKSVKRCKE